MNRYDIPHSSDTGEKKWEDKLHDLYYSPGIIRAIKSKKMRWAVRLACVGEIKNT
jgi:hypothetical protein